MSAKLSKESEKIQKFINKKSNSKYYDYSYIEDEISDIDYRNYRKLHGETIILSKTVVLAIYREEPNYEDLLENREFDFLQDIEYSENKMSYDEDMNLLMNSSPGEIINYLTKILKKLI